MGERLLEAEIRKREAGARIDEAEAIKRWAEASKIASEAAEADAKAEGAMTANIGAMCDLIDQHFSRNPEVAGAMKVAVMGRKYPELLAVMGRRMEAE